MLLVLLVLLLLVVSTSDTAICMNDTTVSLVQAATARDQPREAARTAQQPTVDAVLVSITSAETRAFGRRLGRLHRRARGLGDANSGINADLKTSPLP